MKPQPTLWPNNLTDDEFKQLIQGMDTEIARATWTSIFTAVVTEGEQGAQPCTQES